MKFETWKLVLLSLFFVWRSEKQWLILGKNSCSLYFIKVRQNHERYFSAIHRFCFSNFNSQPFSFSNQLLSLYLFPIALNQASNWFRTQLFNLRSYKVNLRRLKVNLKSWKDDLRSWKDDLRSWIINS